MQRQSNQEVSSPLSRRRQGVVWPTGSCSLAGSSKPAKRTPGSAACSSSASTSYFRSRVRTGTATNPPENSRFSPTVPLRPSLLSGLWICSLMWHHAEDGISVPWVPVLEVSRGIIPYHKMAREAPVVIRPHSWCGRLWVTEVSHIL